MLPFALIVGAHVLWRYAYYGFLLPNTFYAKVNGIWLSQGAKYFVLFAEDYRVLWLLPLLAGLVWNLRDRSVQLFLAIIVTYCVYLACIGGDRFEFRFLVVVLPYFYWLIAESVRRLTERIGVISTRPVMRTAVGWGFAVGLALMTQLGSVSAEARVIRHNVASIDHIREFARKRIDEGRYLRTLVDRGVLPEDVRICVGGAGAVPYYSRLYTVDFFGLNDVRIAHEPIERRGVIAHEHTASLDYLIEKNVAMFGIFDSLVHDGDPNRLRARVTDQDTIERLRCPRIGDRYLVFATMLSDGEFEELFGHLERVY